MINVFDLLIRKFKHAVLYLSTHNLYEF